MIVRASTTEDATALAEIYGHHVLNGFGTFEEVPPSVQDMAARRQAIVERGLPYLVAEAAGRVLGFAYAGPFRPRAAYRYTVEDSVYIAPDALGRGVGKALMEALIARARALGKHVMIAAIDAGNPASLALHKTLGFREVGLLPQVGMKFGRWLDLAFLQLTLDERATPG